ncbi:MAG: hypothetical protein ACFB02_09585 [Mastigocoleus sp.]
MSESEKKSSDKPKGVTRSDGELAPSVSDREVQTFSDYSNTDESLGIENPIRVHQPIKVDRLQPQFLVPLGVNTISILDKDLISPKHEESGGIFFQESPFFFQYNNQNPSNIQKHNLNSSKSKKHNKKTPSPQTNQNPESDSPSVQLQSDETGVETSNLQTNQGGSSSNPENINYIQNQESE